MKQALSPALWLLLATAAPNANGKLALSHPILVSEKHEVSLTAESTGWSAELQWVAVFDKDLVSFYVQRSSDGVDYQDIITYDNYFLTAGIQDSYREQDNDPQLGENFYRIRFVLADGEQIFSERRLLYFREVPTFEIFPNPTGRQVNLMMRKFMGKSVEILVFDGTGTQVYQQLVPKVDDGFLRIELASMKPGMYAISVVHNGRTYTRRLAVTG